MSKIRYRIELVGLTDCKNFVNKIEKSGKKAKLTDGNGYCVSAKSLLGALAALEWDELYVESEDSLYNEIKEWVISDENWKH